MRSGSYIRGLIDTPILIGMRQGDDDAFRFATALLARYPIELSELSAMVLVTRCPAAPEIRHLLQFLGNCKVHRITAPISERSLRLLSKLPPPSVLTAEDTVVAVTALSHKLPLYTLDPDRFAVVPGLISVSPY